MQLRRRHELWHLQATVRIRKPMRKRCRIGLDVGLRGRGGGRRSDRWQGRYLVAAQCTARQGGHRLSGAFCNGQALVTPAAALAKRTALWQQGQVELRARVRYRCTLHTYLCTLHRISRGLLAASVSVLSRCISLCNAPALRLMHSPSVGAPLERARPCQQLATPAAKSLT